MACRDLEDCERAKASLRERIANKSIECRELDLASIESIRKFADGILECKYLIYPLSRMEIPSFINETISPFSFGGFFSFI